jgi:hypothetical protein
MRLRFIIFLGLGILPTACKKISSPITPTQPTSPVTTLPTPLPYTSKATIPISDAIVRECFTGMKMQGVHPRLLYSSNDISKLLQQINSSTLLKGGYDDVMQRANQLLGASLLNYGLDAAGLRIPSIHTIGNDWVPYLVLAYQFTKDSRYALKCWQQLEVMCNFPDWGANRHFLDAGIAAKAIAISLDGLYEYLTEVQRAKLYQSVKTFTLQPGKTQIETKTGVWKWYLSNDNWNGICHGGMIMAALSGYEFDTTFNSSIIALCSNGLLPYVKSLEPDGASEEGLGYWAYGLSNTFLALESMKKCLSTTYGLAENPGFKKTGWFPYLLAGPVGTASIGDDYTYNGKNYRFLSYAWFAQYFQDADFAKTHTLFCQSVNAGKASQLNGWTDLLFYSPMLAANGSSFQPPLSGYIRGLEYAFLLDKNNDEAASYIGMHAGENAASHGHLDAGSFYLQALGENFGIGNLGRPDSYPADYFNVSNPSYLSAAGSPALTAGRYYYYRVKSESKNCIIVNPDSRPEQKPDGKAFLLSQASDASGGYFQFSLTDCYSRDMLLYNRGIKINRTTGTMLVQDEFTLKSESLVYWLMQTPATDALILSADGRSAGLTRNGKTLYAVIRSPANASFEKVARSPNQILYLPETAPYFSGIMNGKNPNNPYFGKLQIRLPKLSGKITISVEFVTKPPISIADPIPMATWTTQN